MKIPLPTAIDLQPMMNFADKMAHGYVGVFESILDRMPTVKLGIEFGSPADSAVAGADVGVAPAAVAPASVSASSSSASSSDGSLSVLLPEAVTNLFSSTSSSSKQLDAYGYDRGMAMPPQLSPEMQMQLERQLMNQAQRREDMWARGLPRQQLPPSMRGQMMPEQRALNLARPQQPMQNFQQPFQMGGEMPPQVQPSYGYPMPSGYGWDSVPMPNEMSEPLQMSMGSRAPPPEMGAGASPLRPFEAQATAQQPMPMYGGYPGMQQKQIPDFADNGIAALTAPYGNAVGGGARAFAPPQAQVPFQNMRVMSALEIPVQRSAATSHARKHSSSFLATSFEDAEGGDGPSTLPGQSNREERMKKIAEEVGAGKGIVAETELEQDYAFNPRRIAVTEVDVIPAKMTDLKNPTLPICSRFAPGCAAEDAAQSAEEEGSQLTAAEKGSMAGNLAVGGEGGGAVANAAE